jgi:hypothetical protein
MNVFRDSWRFGIEVYLRTYGEGVIPGWIAAMRNDHEGTCVSLTAGHLGDYSQVEGVLDVRTLWS